MRSRPGSARRRPANAAAAPHRGRRRLYLTTTHFHPEHAFGAASFAGAATYLVNRAQAEDRDRKGTAYLQMFAGLDPAIAHRLEGVELSDPDLVYDDSYDLDLGGRTVQLRATGRAHSRGDQVIRVPDADVLFTGDLAETGQFAIFPWFPPYDVDVSGLRWLDVMKRLEADRPHTVVPGHGDPGGPEILTTVRTYLELLRDETWARRDSPTLADDLTALLTARYPDWTGHEWIDKGVACLCAEHPAVTAPAG